MKCTVKKAKAEEQKCDVLVVTVFEDEKKPSALFKTVDKKLKGVCSELVKEEAFKGAANTTLMVHSLGTLPAARVLLVGLGRKDELTVEGVRKAVSKVTAAAKAVKANRVVMSMDSVLVENAETVAQAAVEGADLTAYAFSKYKGKEEQKELQAAAVKELVLITEGKDASKMRKGVETGQLFAKATMYVRDMVNEPAVSMKPKTLVAEARKVAKNKGVSVKVMNEAAARKLGMGTFLSVAQGSDEEGYMVHLTYKPTGVKKPKKVVICGKGITFDAGGISLKPTGYIETMKMDMAGAALVLGVFSALTELKPNVEVHGMMAVTENMPSGKATRPGDVVTSYSGKTVEILNTDAEGRLVLADALAYAEKTIKPDLMFDFATLTGAAIVALGQEVACMMGTDEKLVEQYKQASATTGESVWELPLVPEYKQFMKSSIADVQNIAKVKWAGTITAGIFLNHFVEKTPWVHVDIAGPAFAEQQVLPYTPTGGTGYGVRTMLQFLKDMK